MEACISIIPKRHTFRIWYHLNLLSFMTSLPFTEIRGVLLGLVVHVCVCVCMHVCVRHLFSESIRVVWHL